MTFEVLCRDKKGEEIFKISPQELGISKRDCFLEEFLNRMSVYGLTFANPNTVIENLKKIKLSETADLFLYENTNYYFLGYKICKRGGKIICCPEKRIKDSLFISKDQFALKKS